MLVMRKMELGKKVVVWGGVAIVLLLMAWGWMSISQAEVVKDLKGGEGVVELRVGTKVSVFGMTPRGILIKDRQGRIFSLPADSIQSEIHFGSYQVTLSPRAVLWTLSALMVVISLILWMRGVTGKSGHTPERLELVGAKAKSDFLVIPLIALMVMAFVHDLGVMVLVLVTVFLVREAWGPEKAGMILIPVITILGFLNAVGVKEVVVTKAEQGFFVGGAIFGVWWLQGKNPLSFFVQAMVTLVWVFTRGAWRIPFVALPLSLVLAGSLADPLLWKFNLPQGGQTWFFRRVAAVVMTAAGLALTTFFV